MNRKSGVVLLIPGIFDRGKSMLRMQQALSEVGLSAYYLNLEYNSGWRGMEFLSLQLKNQVGALVREGTSCALVGFSMGGIVARHYLQALGGVDRVHKFISLSSPHYGSFWANFLPYMGGRELRKSSEFLDGLNNNVDSLAPTAPVSIWTKYDITILPPISSRLPLGNTYQVPVMLHRWVPSDKRVVSIVSAELRAALSL